MFNRKKISQLEARVDVLEKKVFDLVSKVIQYEKDIDCLKTKMKDLIAFDNYTCLDPVAFNCFVERMDEDEKEFWAGCKDRYEKRLRKFIRQTTSKKKIKQVTDGKETTEAAE